MTTPSTRSEDCLLWPQSLLNDGDHCASQGCIYRPLILGRMTRDAMAMASPNKLWYERKHLKGVLWCPISYIGLWDLFEHPQINHIYNFKFQWDIWWSTSRFWGTLFWNKATSGSAFWSVWAILNLLETPIICSEHCGRLSLIGPARMNSLSMHMLHLCIWVYMLYLRLPCMCCIYLSGKHMHVTS